MVAAARAGHGPDVIGALYQALGEAVWHAPAPPEASFEAILADTARPRDLPAALDRAGLPRELAQAAADASFDREIRAETEQAVARVGGGVGTPILSFRPPNGPAFFGPVIHQAPDGEDALRLWDAVTTLAGWPGFAELKRTLRAFPTPR